MKKSLMIGMLVLGTTAMVSTSYANTKGAAVVRTREAIHADYTKEITAHIERTLGKGKGVTTETRAQMEPIVAELGVSGVKASSILSAMVGTSSATLARIKSLAAIIGAKKMALASMDKDKAESESIIEAAEASAGVLASATLIGAKETKIKGEDLKTVREALNKIETLAADILMKFSKAERDSYTKVLEKYEELVNSGKFAPEDALVEAIMQVKGVSREKAMETVRKLKDCV